MNEAGSGTRIGCPNADVLIDAEDIDPDMGAILRLLGMLKVTPDRLRHAPEPHLPAVHDVHVWRARQPVGQQVNVPALQLGRLRQYVLTYRFSRRHARWYILRKAQQRREADAQGAGWCGGGGAF